MTAPRSRARRGLRVLRWLGRGVIALSLMAVGAYLLIAHSAFGRERVRQVLLAQLEPLIAGKLELDAITRLEASGVELRGLRARDPTGALVLDVRALAVDWTLARLLADEPAIDRIALRAVRADFADLSPRRGVLAAFTPRAPPSPAADGSPPVALRIAAIELDDVALQLATPELGALAVRELSLRAGYRQRDGALELTLHGLQAELLRAGEELAVVEAARGRLASAGAASLLQLRVRSGASTLELTGSGRLPGDPRLPNAPLQVSLALSGIDRDLLARLGQPALAARWLRPVQLELRLGRSVAAPEASFSLRSEAGTVEGSARMDEHRRVRFELRAVELAPGELLAELPPGRVTFALGGEAEFARAPDAIPLSLRLSGAVLDGQALPELSARAELHPDGVRALQLDAEGYGGTLALGGEATYAGDARGTLELSLPSLRQLPAALRAQPALRGDGSFALKSRFALQGGRLQADGTVRARTLALPDLSLRALDGSFTLRGALAAPRVQARLRLVGGRRGELVLHEAGLELAGGPERYKLVLRARANQGALDARAAVRREPGAWTAQLTADGALRGSPFALKLQRARLGDDASLAVDGLALTALGQRLTLDGRIDRARTGDLQLNGERIDLAALSSALGLQPALQGHASLRVRARGALQAPALELSLRGEQLALAAGPRHQLELDGALDALAGHAQLRASVHSGERFAARLTGSAEFAAGTRPGWSQRVASARFDTALELERLDARFVQAWLLAAAGLGAGQNGASGEGGERGLPELPWPARVEGRVHASGSVQEPALDGELRAKVRDRAHARTLELTLHPRYAAGAGELVLFARDPDGPWLDAELRFSHPERSSAAVLRDVARLAHEAAYEARVELAPRRVAVLPGAPELPAEQAQVTAGGRLRAEHAPRGEPRAELALRVHQPGRPGAQSCQQRESAIDLDARLGDRRLDARAVLLRQSVPLVTLESSATLVLEPLLARGALPGLGDVGLEGRIAELELSSLPFLCERVSGVLAGTLRGERLLGDDPRLRVELRAKRLSLQPSFSLDAELGATIGAQQSTLELALQHGATRSSLWARLPLKIRGKQVQLPDDQPLAARLVLDRLPAAALALASGPVSRVSGTLSGKLELSGTRVQPRLLGRLQLARVGLTATALAQPLSDLDGTIAFQPGRIVVERLTARDGDGTLQLNGSARIGKDGGLAMTVKLRADEFPLRQQGRIAGDLDASAAIDVALSEQRNRVAVQREDVSIWLRGGDSRRGIDLAPHPDIVDPRSARLPDAAAPSARSATPLELVLDARDSFWVRRDDFAVKMSLRLEARSDQRGVAIRGPVILQRGYLTLLGRDFAIAEKSRLDFVGDSPPDPVLAIEATAESRRSGQRVTVQISGRTSAPELQFSVDGKAQSAPEAARALFSDPNASDEKAASQVQSFAGGLTSGILGVSLRRELGGMVPILVIEPASSTSSARVRAGFELDAIVPQFMRKAIRGVYVEGMFASGSEERNQNAEGGVLLELYLPADLVTSGQYGPGQTWSLDLGWEP